MAVPGFCNLPDRRVRPAFAEQSKAVGHSIDKNWRSTRTWASKFANALAIKQRRLLSRHLENYLACEFAGRKRREHVIHVFKLIYTLNWTGECAIHDH